MGRLVIAHHKSYHPYKAENIERVRRDEEEARLKEAQEEGRLRLADSEARIDLLRKRAGISNSRTSKRAEREDIIPDAVKASLKENEEKQSHETQAEPIQSLMRDGHINLFADLETKEQIAKEGGSRTKSRKGKAEEEDLETDKGYRLAPSEADRKPWYTRSKGDGQPTMDAGKWDREELRKQRHDPLKEVEASLSRACAGQLPQRSQYPSRPPMKQASIPPSSSSSNPLLESRLSREAAERQRAAELIARKRRERVGAETPSTVAPSEAGYGNLYNKDDVEEAARRRRDQDGHRWKERVRHWDGTDGRGRKW
ncbi:hypothetical protein FRC17_011227 [Serendipita sp. 399]|nr:hypothetical protein FRC17_011227 [Serendipita sp. 399]